eukprot:COSAG02_NODE_7220_length_3111_cov_23.130218_9_plen_30_part_01
MVMAERYPRWFGDPGVYARPRGRAHTNFF